MGNLISVIIPARDCEAVIRPCLDALAAQTLSPEEVIVVDDASTDATAEVVRDHYPGVRLISLAQRRGFTGACLAGYEAAKGDWIAALNADAEPDPDWLREAIALAGEDERVGMIAARVVLAEPAGTVDSNGLAINRTGMARLADHQRTDPDAKGGASPREVFGPAGSAALYRRSALDEAGFFERDFFLFYEDVDLAFRLRWRGYSCRLAPGSRVVHRHSYVTGREPQVKRYYLQRNRLRTLVRNWPAASLLLYLPAIIVFDLASIARAALEGSLGAALHARLDFLKALPGDLAVRRQTMNAARVPDAEMGKWIGK